MVCRYVIRDGKASTNGKIMGRGQYFGHEMLLENFRRWHSVHSLTFLDAFRLEKADLAEMMRSGAFPRMEVGASVHLVAVTNRGGTADCTDCLHCHWFKLH